MGTKVPEVSMIYVSVNFPDRNFSFTADHVVSLFLRHRRCLAQLSRELPIQLGPVAQASLEFLVVDVRHRSLGSRAGRDGKEVVHVRLDAEQQVLSVAARIGVPDADLDVVYPIVDGRRVAIRQPVLGRCVAVVEDEGRQPRHQVIHVCDAELGTCLVGHKVGERCVPDAGRPKRVEVHGVARLAEACGCDGSNRSS